jgi:hypothetical protein
VGCQRRGRGVLPGLGLGVKKRKEKKMANKAVEIHRAQWGKKKSVMELQE